MATPIENKHWYSHILPQKSFHERLVRKAKTFSSNHFGSVVYWDDLIKKLVEQDYKCAVTGLEICPIEQASLDHIFPKSTYPELADDLSNVQWVDAAINRAKYKMQPDYFENWLFKLYRALKVKFEGIE